MKDKRNVAHLSPQQFIPRNYSQQGQGQGQMPTGRQMQQQPRPQQDMLRPQARPQQGVQYQDKPDDAVRFGSKVSL